jgi:hypothetical protein
VPTWRCLSNLSSIDSLDGFIWYLLPNDFIGMPQSPRGAGLFIGNLNNVCGSLWNKIPYIREVHRKKKWCIHINNMLGTHIFRLSFKPKNASTSYTNWTSWTIHIRLLLHIKSAFAFQLLDGGMCCKVERRIVPEAKGVFVTIWSIQ